MKIPQNLHKPITVLWWDADEFAIIAFFAMLTALVNIKFAIFLFGIPWALRHIKKNYPRGFLKQIFYFLGIQEISGYPPYYEREFNE